jgi:hypothetical protein
MRLTVDCKLTHCAWFSGPLSVTMPVDRCADESR